MAFNFLKDSVKLIVYRKIQWPTDVNLHILMKIKTRKPKFSFSNNFILSYWWI